MFKIGKKILSLLAFTKFFVLFFAISNASAFFYDEHPMVDRFMLGFIGYTEDYKDRLDEVNFCVYSPDRNIAFTELRQFINVRKLKDYNDLKNCQYLYVSNGDEAEVKDLVEYANENKIVTVGEGVEFVIRGGVFALYVKRGKLRFYLNKEQYDKLGVKVSPMILEMAYRYN